MDEQSQVEHAGAIKWFSYYYCREIKSGDTKQAEMYMHMLREMGVETVDCEAIHAEMDKPSINQRIAKLLEKEMGWQVVIPEQRYWMSSIGEWVLEYTLDEDGEPEALPDWESNMDDALALVRDDLEFELSRSSRDEWHVCVHQVYYATGREPAVAICKAWLEWKVAHSPNADVPMKADES